IRPFAGARADLLSAREELFRSFPGSHWSLLRSMPTSYVLGDYVFVHAGVRTGVPLAQQKTHDLLWLREGFSDRDDPFEKIVVHGHTSIEAPYFGRYRINIDTGAYATNTLTCLVLEGSKQVLLRN